MTNNATQKIKTGIFILAGVGVLLLIMYFISSKKNLFSSTISLHVKYKTVSGLQQGAYVRFAGINVGVVDLIDIENDTTVDVTLIVQKKVQKFIKADSRASIGSDGLMGDKLVQIMPGKDSSALIKENGTLKAINPYDMDKLMGKAEKVGAKIENIVTNMDTLSGHLSSIFGKVNNGRGTLGRLINNDKLATELEETVASAKTTVRTANKAAEGLSQNMEAAKHNFLLKGFFKSKEKKRIADSIAQVKAAQQPDLDKKKDKKN
ncbi:MlaD family protein [Parasediminibacterium sp. JCM 36343]|uniref:MlaD family protein n=1 Tax=Parasediminibacterium sp. JCM 36343 TaxID=3374279 RepID=UPI003979C8AB